jgi:hypothetical protein
VGHGSQLETLQAQQEMDNHDNYRERLFKQHQAENRLNRHLSEMRFFSPQVDNFEIALSHRHGKHSVCAGERIITKY